MELSLNTLQRILSLGKVEHVEDNALVRTKELAAIIRIVVKKNAYVSFAFYRWLTDEDQT